MIKKVMHVILFCFISKLKQSVLCNKAFTLSNMGAIRAYFRKRKHLGIRCFINIALFEKNVFLNISETYQK